MVRSIEVAIRVAVALVSVVPMVARGQEVLLPPPPPPLPVETRPQAPAAALGFLVRFEPADPKAELTVTVDEGESCLAPCEQRVTPGSHAVTVAGSGSFTQEVVFRDGDTRVIVEGQDRHLRNRGIVGVSVGGGMLVVGLVYLGVGLANGNYKDYGSDLPNVSILFPIAILAGGATLAGALGGTGFGRMGSNRITLAPEKTVRAEPAPVLRLVSVGFAPTKSGAAASATFTF